MKIVDDVRGQLEQMLIKREIVLHNTKESDGSYNRNIKKALVFGYFS